MGPSLTLALFDESSQSGDDLNAVQLLHGGDRTLAHDLLEKLCGF